CSTNAPTASNSWKVTVIDADELYTHGRFLPSRLNGRRRLWRTRSKVHRFTGLGVRLRSSVTKSVMVATAAVTGSAACLRDEPSACTRNTTVHRLGATVRSA